MKLFFGLHLDEFTKNIISIREKTYRCVGPNQFLALLETLLGFEGYASDIEYLRIEQYRQLLKAYLESNEAVFYAKSFSADQFATSETILKMRDELLLNGWDFSHQENMPERLKVLAELEVLNKNRMANERLEFGLEDRWIQVFKTVPHRLNRIEEIIVHEPRNLMPVFWQRLFQVFEQHNTLIRYTNNRGHNGHSDLGKLKKLLDNNGSVKEKEKLEGDGTLIVFKGKRANQISPWLAQFCQKNPEFKPEVLIEQKDWLLDQAFIQIGLPSLGVSSTSLARPALQVLKLVSAFLWEPIDAKKMLEFVTLSIKPIDDSLGQVIARLFSEAPGIGGDNWKRGLNIFFDEQKTKDIANFGQLYKQYQFWFERKRYAQEAFAPKKDILELFNYVHTWSKTLLDNLQGTNSSFLLLMEQSRKIVELLNTIPEQKLTYLELERIVRTIYEPTPGILKEEEEARLDYNVHPACFIEPTKEVLWWNFIEREAKYFFPKWYKAEIDYLLSNEVEVESPDIQNQRRLWQQFCPIRSAQERLVIVIPENLHGETVLPHPLWAYFEACFTELEPIIINLDNPKNDTDLLSQFQLPGNQIVSYVDLKRTEGFAYLKQGFEINSRSHETPTSLELLLHYPDQWFLRYIAKLNHSTILSISKENRLYGNLAHKLFERLFEQNIKTWDKTKTESWIEKQMTGLLRKEGVTLLAYGNEPLRISFTNKMKYAAWSLIQHIVNNNWEVLNTEMQLEGNFLDLDLKGIADLVLKRGKEYAILDLKWRGHRFRESLIKNEEDLQLALYAKMLKQKKEIIYTGYFILEKGLLLMRTKQGFKDINPIADESMLDAVAQRIEEKMFKTYHWRRAQIAKGFVEIRNKTTAEDLESRYLDEGINLLDLLELKKDNPPFDSYGVLSGLIN